MPQPEDMQIVSLSLFFCFSFCFSFSKFDSYFEKVF